MADENGELLNETTQPQVHPILHAMEIVSRHKALLVLGGVVGLALGILFYVMSQPTYQSGAQVLVVKKRGDDLGRHLADTRMAEDYVATHQDLIRSHVIIMRALNKPVWYKLTDESLKSLEWAGLPPGILARLGTLKNERSARRMPRCAGRDPR